MRYASSKVVKISRSWVNLYKTCWKTAVPTDIQCWPIQRIRRLSCGTFETFPKRKWQLTFKTQFQMIRDDAIIATRTQLTWQTRTIDEKLSDAIKVSAFFEIKVGNRFWLYFCDWGLSDIFFKANCKPLAPLSSNKKENLIPRTAENSSNLIFA